MQATPLQQYAPGKLYTPRARERHGGPDYSWKHSSDGVARDFGPIDQAADGKCTAF